MATRNVKVRGRGSLESLRRLSGEAKVRLAVEMSTVAQAITLQSIRDKNPGISEREFQKLARKRFDSGRTRRPATSGSREFKFYVSRSPELDKRYLGKHIAIVGERIVASGRSPLEIYKRAKKSHPKSKPLLAYVPKGEILVCAKT